MNHEFELKLMAYLDGELPAREAREVEAEIGRNPDAQALLSELRMSAEVMRQNEPTYALPEAREFFWSKVERAILATEAGGQPVASPLSWCWWRRYWPQWSGALVAAVVLALGSYHYHWYAPAGLDEVEDFLSDSSSFTFRSEQQRMTLVWVSNPTTVTAVDDNDDGFDWVN